MRCFVIYFDYSVNNSSKRSGAGNNCAIVSRSLYIWIWSEARDQESTNHSARFVKWKSSYITLTNRKWFSVFCSLIDNDIRHHSGPNLWTQYSTPKKVFFSERDQNHDTKKEQALSKTFSQYDWFISQNERSWLAITLRDKLTRVALCRLPSTTTNDLIRMRDYKQLW